MDKTFYQTRKELKNNIIDLQCNKSLSNKIKLILLNDILEYMLEYIDYLKVEIQEHESKTRT